MKNFWWNVSTMSIGPVKSFCEEFLWRVVVIVLVKGELWWRVLVKSFGEWSLCMTCFGEEFWWRVSVKSFGEHVWFFFGEEFWRRVLVKSLGDEFWWRVSVKSFGAWWVSFGEEFFFFGEEWVSPKLFTKKTKIFTKILHRESQPKLFTKTLTKTLHRNSSQKPFIKTVHPNSLPLFPKLFTKTLHKTLSTETFVQNGTQTWWFISLYLHKKLLTKLHKKLQPQFFDCFNFGKTKRNGFGNYWYCKLWWRLRRWWYILEPWHGAFLSTTWGIILLKIPMLHCMQLFDVWVTIEYW